ncbi:Lysophosphatidylcholine acyltransferase 1 [Acipenser ruthenus]|uniref:Lysophosphatidylcholine acyltransferase 1 n=1 Tax=Acipenser ruthenus TaxID=7906 RepID=A0A444UK07_ACIRT|nr:Lysophosphatidylcholine acyltransferase 1 [Acipenser ruthenus]
MRLTRNSRRCSTVGEDGKKELAPPFRNPFVHEIRFTPLQKAQIAVMTVTLFPIRLFFAAFMMLLAWPFAFLASMGRSEKVIEPISWWRKVFDVLLKVIMRAMWFAGGFHWMTVKGRQALPTEAPILTLAPHSSYFDAVGSSFRQRVFDVLLKVIMRAMWFAGGFHWMTVKGRQALPTEAPILTLAPHSSYFDAIPVTMTMASIVMKAESKDIPVWGTLIKYIRPVFVSRSDQDSRKKTVEEIKRRAHSEGKWPQKLSEKEKAEVSVDFLYCRSRQNKQRDLCADMLFCHVHIIISQYYYNNSSRSNVHGAFIPAVPVQPVVLRYPNKMDTITWTWQGPGAFDILWLTLCQLHNVVEIEFLPVYTPSDEEKKNPALFANNVRRLMAKALEVPVTDYSFEDCQLAMAEGQLKLPAETCLLEFAKLVRRLSLKPEKVEKDLEEYSERARKTKGKRLDLEGFASYLNLTVSDTLKDMFALFDENEDGTMDAREYVIALSVVCRPSKTLATIQLAFKMYESEQDRTILEEHLACILKTALGVSELNVTDLFRAIDNVDKGKITFDDFNDFAEQNPDFAEEYLYPDQTRFLSSAETPSAPIANGFCTDFSPEDQYEEERRPLRKKIN